MVKADIEEERKSLKTFKELSLIDPLQKALAEQQYEIPTPIQAKTIPHALKRCDILGCAQTGTGKTAAFALPILNRLGQQNRKAKPKRPFALILAPTRELAVQIGDSFEVYGRHLKFTRCVDLRWCKSKTSGTNDEPWLAHFGCDTGTITRSYESGICEAR